MINMASLELVRTIPCLPLTTRGQPIVINAHPKGETFLYCHDKNVVIRSIDKPAESDVYSEHAYQALVAKYAPSGFYIASGDKSGRLRIWDTVNVEHILKNEFQVLSGPVKDIDWDNESKRLVVAGEGRSSFTAAISADTGTSLGEMKGHSKSANTIAYKPTRPFRVASGGEDFCVSFYQGPPFKCEKSHHEHNNFVNVVRYAPNGEFFVSAGADKRILVYDGKSSDLIGELGDPAHKAGIYAVSFSQDSQRLVSASADKTIKIWSTKSTGEAGKFEFEKEPLATYQIGADVNDMQVSCLWAREDTIISVSLSGCIHFFTPDSLSDGPRLTLRGHNKPISAFATHRDDSGTLKLLTASSEGNMISWNLESGEATFITGDRHKSQVQSIAVTSDGQMVSVGFDDTLRCTSLAELKCGVVPSRKLDSQPKCIAAGGDLVAIGRIGSVDLTKKGADLSKIAVSYHPTCLAFNNDCSILAIGGDDKDIHLYRVPTGSGDASEVAKVETVGQVLSLSFSSDGSRLAATDGSRKVYLINTADWTAYADFGHHSARVTCCAWSPDGKSLATGSLDTNIIVIPTDGSRSKVMYKGAHPKSQVNGIAWLDNQRLVTAGQDSMIRLWKFVSA